MDATYLFFSSDRASLHDSFAMASNTLPTSLSRLLNVTGETVGMFKHARKLFKVVSSWTQKSKAEILTENIYDKNTYYRYLKIIQIYPDYSVLQL